ncbi:Alanine--glyoxylate aminotransferase 2-like protein 3 [Hibiscus syriacus]|uniref:Alanine--glyoxylate aminotransferase 2-like protein 3 n=1 Tax=Hibiscus syriacus TaxID=106335 RepID=A0A6A3BTP9_HIBSY|nr:Alanine--glyoxylate aminotransferase 2-like protein 3 [Hibiscus syriacus]
MLLGMAHKYTSKEDRRWSGVSEANINCPYKESLVVGLRIMWVGGAGAQPRDTVQEWSSHAVTHGVFGSDGEKYARDVQDIIQFGTSGNIAGFISEAIQGVGGIIELAPGYLPAVYSTIKKAGGLCIADEVQAGFARTGSHFWGFENYGVVPDIVIMAKIVVVLTCRNYFNTFGGNPVCTALGLAVLKVIEKEKLQENALTYLKERLTALKDKYDLIGDVRGRGLMLGVEFVTDQKLKTPAKLETLHIMDQMKG